MQYTTMPEDLKCFSVGSGSASIRKLDSDSKIHNACFTVTLTSLAHFSGALWIRWKKTKWP